MSKKSQALQIADDLDRKQRIAYSRRDANDPCSPEAALIRQQHAAIVALTEALELIAATDPVDAALDPQRAARVARATLAEHGAKS